MDQAPPPRPSYWRFTLRELLLVTLAASAILALMLNRRWYGPPFLQPSVLLQEFGMPDPVHAAAQRCKLSRRSLEDTGGTYTSSGNMASRFISYRVDAPPGVRDQFLSELRSDARHMLRRGGHTTIFDQPMLSDKDRAGFRLTYRGPHSRGQIIVRPVDLSGEQMDLMIFVYEHLER